MSAIDSFIIGQRLSDALDDFPPWLIELSANLPERQPRRDAAETIKRELFPVSRRSLEVWPVPTRIVNGRAVARNVDWLREAWTERTRPRS